MAQLKLSTPWDTLARKMQAIFDGDDEVTVTPDFRGDNRVIRIYVASPAKAVALGRLLPGEIALGSVKVTIAVVSVNGEPTVAALMRTAFAGNPNVARVTEVPMRDGSEATYVEFKPEVAQFWNDDLSNPGGVTSGLLADFAKELFPTAGALFTTAAKEG